MEKIRYAEIGMNTGDILEFCVGICKRGKKVCITADKKHLPFLFSAFIKNYPYIGIDDSIQIGPGKLFIAEDSIEYINKKSIDVLVCSRYSIIGRDSQPILPNVKMIRVI